MSFDSVPADFVLKIFHQLPFKDRAHLAGVNRLFRYASTESINKMKSLTLNDDRDLVAYSIRSMQSFTALLESCSCTLESIDATNWECSKLLVNSLTEFAYPNLKHLKISVISLRICKIQTKKLLSRSRNLRSIVLKLSDAFEWPENFKFENLENLDIHKMNNDVSLSSILRPLIGNVPRLKRLIINTGNEILSVQEFNQLLASTQCLGELNLELSHRRRYDDDETADVPYAKMFQDFVSSIPTWRLPLLTKLAIDFDDTNMFFENPIPSSVLHNFSTSFPRLISFKSWMIKEIDERAMMELSRLTYFRELRLPCLTMTRDKFSHMVTSMPNIVVLEISDGGLEIMGEPLLTLSQLQYLRELDLSMRMSKNELVTLITNVPSLAVLKISDIKKVDGLSREAFADFRPKEFIDFLMSTAAIFHRNLEIRLSSTEIYILTSDLELEQMKASLEEMKKNGGPIVEMEGLRVKSIRYRSTIGAV